MALVQHTDTDETNLLEYPNRLAIGRGIGLDTRDFYLI